MKDIKLDKWYKKAHYFFSLMMLVSGFGWLITLGLSVYGKSTSNDVEPVKDLLNKTWQKYTFVYGLVSEIMILVYILILMILSIIDFMF